MTEPRDEIDNWLGREVEPLPPPPGTFDRIHRRARRRKTNQALTAVTGAVVVIAGAVLIPTVATGMLASDKSSPPPPAAASSTTHSATPTPTTSPSRSTPSQTVTVAPVGGTGLSATTSGASPPPNFQPTSVTMIGGGIGAVIGQAGDPGHCGPPIADDCTSLAGTSSYGATWYGVSAPVTGVPKGSTGASQLRFLNLKHGWAFGPGLWQTSDQGRHWTAMSTNGSRVTALEAGGSRAFVVLASCHGNRTDYAIDCSTFSLYSAAAGSSTLQPVKLVIPARHRAGAMGSVNQPASAALAIAGNAANPQQGTGYLLTPAGDIVSGAVSSSTWTYLGMAPCAPGPATGTGAPRTAQLTIGSGGDLLLNCSASASQLWRSADGVTWTKAGAPPAGAPGQPQATSLAGTSTGQVVLATTAGIDYSPDGQAWHHATISGGAPSGGFSYVGMTSSTQGVAVPADAKLGEIFVTSDGGLTWTPSRISG